MQERLLHYTNVFPSLEKFNITNKGRDYSFYATAMDSSLEEKMKFLLDEIGEIKENACIVDAGSGTGAIANKLAKIFPQSTVFALDLSNQARSIKDKVDNLIFKTCDIVLQNFPNNTVDIKYFFSSGHEIESNKGLGGGYG